MEKTAFPLVLRISATNIAAPSLYRRDDRRARMATGPLRNR